MTALIDENYSLIPPGDPRYFSQTCFKPYDIHKYKVHMESGKIVDYDDYMDAQSHWFQNPFAKHITVHDRKK